MDFDLQKYTLYTKKESESICRRQKVGARGRALRLPELDIYAEGSLDSGCFLLLGRPPLGYGTQGRQLATDGSLSVIPRSQAFSEAGL